MIPDNDGHEELCLNKTASTVLVRFVEQQEAVDPGVKTLLTLAMLLYDDVRLFDVWNVKRPVDDVFVDKFLEAALDEELAELLWRPICLQLPSPLFKTLFFRAYENAESVDALRCLGGAAHDFFRLHPSAFDIPCELPDKLLQSSSVDARIVGLKLMQRCGSLEQRLTEILRAMRRDEIEQYGALYQLGELLDSTDRATLAAMPPQLVDDLRSTIAQLASKSDDERLKTSATIYYSRLNRALSKSGK